MLQMPMPVWLLSFAQALGMCSAPLVIFVGGIIGARLAPSESMSTLPVAAFIVGSAIASMPAAFIMQRIGRRMGFMAATLLALLGSILAYTSITTQNFWGLCFAIALLGVHIAFIAQFRFAALEWVRPEQAGQAASVVLLGGLIAALIGPELGLQGRDLFLHPFAGSFVLLALVHSGLLLLLWFVPFAPVNAQTEHTVGRPLSELFTQPGLIAAITAAAAGYGVMSLVMTATPVSMTKVQSFALEESKVVIQAHIFAMFLPSLFSPFLFRVLGLRNVMLLGIAAMLCALTVALTGQGFWQYWAALIFLGLGWNFLFVSGTGLLAQQYRPEESFKVQAVNEGVVFSIQAIMSLMSGWMVFNFGWNSLNLFALIWLVLSLVLIGRWVLQKPAAAH